ncbi:HD domain-containing protein [Luteipulveratus mongoliensis]|uniref:Phosphohydrolase n=1 Tax=Luteipulveratus mongoliensis TaxID=571913 RepID=A0A0K1JMX4_9MICO|nr:HD domain-containing protein [Luteipulveratus mongoliensis]AKU18072.1 phosphohydrolase [Luteipulveratus mongoliensis]
MIDEAKDIARRAHAEQVDKAGHAYITHPARVAQRVAGDERAEAVAWLHDVVEDTAVTLADLAETFPAEVVAAVDAITRRKGEDGDDYYDRVARDPLALKVKLADLDDNSDPERLALLDEATRERLTRKYAHARQRLAQGAESPELD